MDVYEDEVRAVVDRAVALADARGEGWLRWRARHFGERGEPFSSGELNRAFLDEAPDEVAPSEEMDAFLRALPPWGLMLLVVLERAGRTDGRLSADEVARTAAGCRGLKAQIQRLGETRLASNLVAGREVAERSGGLLHVARLVAAEEPRLTHEDP